MTGLRVSWLLACAMCAGAATACNVDFPVRIKPCRDAHADSRVNERGDQQEFTGHPLAAAALGNGRILVAFSAQKLDDTTGEVLASEVRIALLDQATGEPLTICNTGNRDRTLSDPGAFAYAASIAPVTLTISASKAVALVAWIEGPSFPDTFLKMRFIDSAGCPLADSFRPYPGPTFASSIVWSEQRHAVLATLHDQRKVYRAWVNNIGPADAVSIAEGQSFIYGFPMGTVASDGSAIVVWAEDRDGAQAVLLDPDGNPRMAAARNPQGVAFPIELPLIAPMANLVLSLSVAAADQFVVAAEQHTVDRSIPARVMAREYTLDGTALTGAYPLDPDDAQDQWSPVLQYAPGGTLVAVWDSKAAGGTVGRLFGSGGAARFNTLSCDDRTFSIGARAPTLFGYPSLLISEGRVLVFHNAQGNGDPVGSATFMWKDHFADLWPGTQ